MLPALACALFLPWFGDQAFGKCRVQRCAGGVTASAINGLRANAGCCLPASAAIRASSAFLRIRAASLTRRAPSASRHRVGRWRRRAIDQADDESRSQTLDAKDLEDHCLQRGIEGRNPGCGSCLSSEGRSEAATLSQRAADPPHFPSPGGAEFLVPVGLANNENDEPEQERAPRNGPKDFSVKI